MIKKRVLACALAGIAFVLLLYLLLTLPWSGWFRTEKEPQAAFRTSGKTIEICQDGQWKPFTVTGVNMGTGYPGEFPNDSAIDKETYSRWFELIAEMNANTVRVYKRQTPEFYAAFADYNETHEEKLYLIQGMDFSDKLIFTEKNLLSPEMHRELFQFSKNTVKALHGDYIGLNKGNLECYLADVSDYVLGYILGIEWDERFVEYVCRLNEKAPRFQGRFLSCSDDATAFESFLAQWGDLVLTCESDTYGVQPLMSFCNWPDTDPFFNKINFMEEGSLDRGAQQDTEATLDVEHILCTEEVHSGMFASYNVYPYFPAFLQHGQYTEYKDETGKPNPYQGYLKELQKHHSYPVIIAEYGIPASRSQAYGDIWQGFSHGGLNETQQGIAMAEMYRDIKTAGCAGSIVFTWQDEWYKTIWNERTLSDSDNRAFWSNAQCAEQFFGLLAFEPGEAGSTVYPDGDLSEWEEEDCIIENDKLSLSVQSDEKYLYLMARGLSSLKKGETVNLAFDVTPKSGKSEILGRTLECPADFILQIDPGKDAALYVDRAYDTLAYSVLGGYGDSSIGTLKRLRERCAALESPLPGSEEFFLVSRADGDIVTKLNKELLINEVGVLKNGNANPESPNYNSNADYCLSGSDTVELRIPWQLLNFYDPAHGKIIDDLEENRYKIETLKIDSIHAAIYTDGGEGPVPFGEYELECWEEPVFHERLKQSYYIMQDVFGGDAK